MKRFVYLVIEDEALEDGTTHSSILCAYHEKADAEREAASITAGVTCAGKCRKSRSKELAPVHSNY
jgi:hypothetical protein